MNKMENKYLGNYVIAGDYSHSIEQVEELCNKVVWLDKGNLKMAGESRNIAEIYSAS